MQSNREIIEFLVVITTVIILILTLTVILILLFYQKKQIKYFNSLNTIKSNYEKSLLSSQLEMQEQTLQHISREIHDNIGLSLTLAKLNLNTLNKAISENMIEKIEESAGLISKAIRDLSAISHGLNANVINNNGLIKALEEETERISKIGVIEANLLITGSPVFLEDQTELLLFRIVQEGMNNIIKYAEATKILITLHFNCSDLELKISDNGKGFSQEPHIRTGSGLLNMKARTQMLNGMLSVNSNTNGTSINVKIPIN